MKRYDQNFKDEALKLSDDIGIKKACEQLNLNYGTLAAGGNCGLRKVKPEKRMRIYRKKTQGSRRKTKG